MGRIEFLTVESFTAWCAEATQKGLAFRASELPHGGFSVQITGY